MCVETPGVPPLLPPARRGPADRINPDELFPLGGASVGWIGHPPTRDPEGATPIVIVCHERYGVVAHTIDLAERFALAGFLTVAPDFYVDAGLTGAEQTLPVVSDDVVLRHLDAAITHARQLPGCGDDSPVAVIGICRSGSYGILASAKRHDVAAVVMLYGGAAPREFEVGPLRPWPYERMIAAGRAPVLGLWGERDHTMSVEHVRKVRDLLEKARRSYEFILYPDLPHGWLNDTMPGRFRAVEAAETFRVITEWLGERLRPGAVRTGQVSWRFRSVISPDYDFDANERLH
jgi:carboxymethylenebutenolidase